MYPKRSNHGNGPAAKPLRTSDRLRSRRNIYTRNYLYFSPMHSTRSKPNRTSASQIAKMLRTDNRPAAAANLRRSTRKRRRSVNLKVYTDSSGTEDDGLMGPVANAGISASEDEYLSLQCIKSSKAKRLPRREGLRPRHGRTIPREYTNFDSDDEHDASADKIYQSGAENEDMAEENYTEDGEDVADAEDGREDDADEDDEADDDGEEQDGKRRYDLRDRSDANRASLEESKQRARFPRRILQQGTGSKVSREIRKGGSKSHKRNHLIRAEDSDDSLLVDELDQGHAIPWNRTGNKSGPSWLFGGIDMHGATSWGLNVAASGWGHHSDAFTALTSGIQTAGPSSKGGADIQPVQIDENISFEDIGGLSEYIDALKEMVFFPLLYPDFFASYNITPPRGVLLCGPPGTGKTLIARALACAASKAGQKVTFYMRKGADVLSKWVGEAERQLKLLFEEAQRNQPSIIFFDEIDGLAPVRSSKQEQIHNSIVSTLLALMDGLDSRGQVVLIGATNRVDAIDGALRRPGRFDREFNFPLPGFDARAEIIDIHTRKWKHSPSKALKLELAASCVGYCGADLKALCTEAAICAFREKYPQVYTSDDKFLIDVDSVKVEKCHFVEAMTTITPAAHRGSVVYSRPLSPVIAPCLQGHLQSTMRYLKDVFPLHIVSSGLAKISLLSCGSAVPLVYRPRFLLLSDDGVGLDHIGPAVLHELERFPIHSIGFPTLLSDPSSKTPEEALVHIFCEARRTSPSILYLPHLHLWWENAYQQLKAVLITLLEEMPSDLPVLLLGTSSLPLSELEDFPSSLFPQHSVYKLEKPSMKARVLFFEHLMGAALSLPCEDASKKSREQASLHELSKAPKSTSGPKLSELKSKIEAEQHALRRLRMCLRDVCNRILYDKRFSAFHYPVMDEDAPNYRSIVPNPMDVATMLQNVDSGRYITCKVLLQDFDLIVDNAKAYNGDDYNGARIVSRACELRDAVHGMLAQMDPALIAFCEKIASQGGPTQLPDALGGLYMHPSSVSTVTRASARLRNVHPDVSLAQSVDALKRPRKHVDVTRADDKLNNREASSRASPDIGANNVSSGERADGPGVAEDAGESRSDDDDTPREDDISSEIEDVKQLFVERTEGYDIPQLERLYTRIIRGAFESKEKHPCSKSSILKFLLEFTEDHTNF